MPSDDTSPVSESGLLQPGEVFAERYEVLQLLGNGGTSTVYKVWDRLPREIIALKLIDPAAAGNPTMLEYFKREISLARRLSHPNVVRIHDLGEHQGQLYISMEYIEGRTLAALLAQRQRLSVGQFLVIFDQLCDGLAYVHSRGVMHRDIKPQNIMADKDGTLKLMDFGLARSSTSSPTRGIAVGTPAYMSPEQIMGKPLTDAADIYSCGAMFFEMLTGQRPLAAMNWADRCTAKPPHFPPDLQGISHELAESIRKCMEPDPSQRFQSVAELVLATKRASQPKLRTSFGDLLTEEPGDLDKLRPLFLKLISALAGVQQSGLTHAQLSPRSIKITEAGDVHIDMAVTAGAGGTVVIREPQYAPPDVSTGVVSDIYSLGIIFYEILLGWKSFRIEFELVLKQGSELAWLEWHGNPETTARPLSEVVPGFPPDVSEVIAMMIAKRPQQRFQSYSAVGTALRRTTEPATKAAPAQPIAAQPVEKTKKQLKQEAALIKQQLAEQAKTTPDGEGERRPVPKVLLIGGVAAVLAVGLVSMFAFKRTPAAKPVPAAKTTALPGTEAKAVAPTPTQFGELPKSIQTSTGTMMLVPDGEFVSGTQGKTAKLASYYMDKTEVTNAAYRMFCDATKRPYPKNPTWDRQYFDKPDYPVLNVSWNDAREFAAWAGKRLPSEDEWEKAARGTEGRTYPWGNWSQSTAANLKGSEDGHVNAAPVGSFPYDESPFGVLDMEGNAEEWVAGDFGDGKKVVRGGGFTATVEHASVTSRRGESPDLAPAVFSNIGFRCAATPDTAMQIKK